ncbi:hypothetical protein ACQP60_04165 [Isoptericola variabilis]|uniref:hypothetical protein n=1 Tax=Isoptericola variabilis TaxID=139208 RepID=UPI003D1DC5A0
MSVQIICGELMTGRILAAVPTTGSGASWSTVLNDSGDVQATVPLRSLNPNTRETLLSYLEPNRCFLGAVTDAGYVLEAGPILPHGYDDATGTLQVKATGMHGHLDRRLAIAPPPWPSGVGRTALSWSGLSLGTIAKRLVATALAHPGGSLPIVLPADQAGTNERTYPGYELGYVGERLRQLAEVEGGPDIAFQPRLTVDGLSVEWVMRTGTTADPLLHQVGDDWRWDRGAVRGPLRLLGVDRDGSDVASRVFSTGDGMEEDLPIGLAETTELTDAGYPLTERVTSTNATDVSRLNAHALAGLGASVRPWQTWALETDVDSPTLGTYRPGDWASVSIPPGHIYLRAGTYRTRILEISGDKSRKVSLKLAPTMEGR